MVLQVVTENTPLALDEDSCVAVNNLSLTGLFGHIILKPNPKPKQPAVSAGQLPRLVILSGRNEEGALQAAEKVNTRLLHPRLVRSWIRRFCFLPMIILER